MAELSFDRIRSLIRAKLLDGRAEPPDFWVIDVYPSQVVWTENARTFQTPYAIVGEEVTLGETTEVREERRYVPVKFALDGPAEFRAGTVVRRGKLFQAGDFPDKRLSVTEEDLAAMAAAFAPVPVNLEHAPTLLDGQLGEVLSVEARGGELFGEVALPGWLHEALGDREIPVSVEIARDTKRLVGLGLVLNPRVSDAALVSAFNHGRASRKGSGMSVIERIKAKLGVALDEIAAEGEGAPPKADFSAELATVRAENARLQAERTRLLDRQIETAAAEFADGLVRDGRLVPAQREAAAAHFALCLRDDSAGDATFAEDGRLTEGERVAALRALYADAPKIPALHGGLAVLDAEKAPKTHTSPFSVDEAYEARRKAQTENH